VIDTERVGMDSEKCYNCSGQRLVRAKKRKQQTAEEKDLRENMQRVMLRRKWMRLKKRL
jgi:hypothetical protein